MKRDFLGRGTGAVRTRALIAALAVAGTHAAAGSMPLGPPTNDTCQSPLPVPSGQHPLDNRPATGEEDIICGGPAGGGTIANDLWYCWTADCDGVLTVSTVGQTGGGGAPLDTVIAIYPGCACPSDRFNPLCCNDDADATTRESLVRCDVVCGQEYMIRIGTVLGSPPGSGTFTITCDGEPCDPQDCDECCARAPRFTGFPGKVAAFTHAPGTPYVLDVLDISDECNAPRGATLPNWSPPSWAQSNPHNWSSGELGSIFGLTFDDDGNIYVAHTSIYGQDVLGSIAGAPPAGAGAVYKVNTLTGNASVLVKLPNNPTTTGCTAGNCFAGLGDVTFRCSSRVLYASNFHDGRIYRIDLAGTILSTWKHSTGTVAAGGAADPLAPNGYIPITPHPLTGRGQRTWAVKPHGDRLFYSVWREDDNRPDPNQANEVWSVALTPAGDFIAGTEQLELSMAAYPYASGTSAPIADIAFNEHCDMLLAERTMASDTSTGAHRSRLLEFTLSGTTWVPSGNTFNLGISNTSSAGGCDYDFDPAACAKVWSIGDGVAFDQITPYYIYGLIGFPPTGGDSTNSVLIDTDTILNQQDKTQQGDVEVTCPPRCTEIITDRIICEVVDGVLTGNYTWTFHFTNNSGQPIRYIAFPANVPITLHTITLPNVVPTGGSSGLITVTITGQQPGQFCFPIRFFSPDIEECCSLEHCIDLPDCDCEQILECEVTCDPNGFLVTFTLQNLSGGPIDEMYIFPEPPGATFTVSPSAYSFATVPNLGTMNFATVISGAPNGALVCLRISIHNDGNECCSDVKCIQLPDCGPPLNDCPADWDESGGIDGDDISAFFVDWQAGHADIDRSGGTDGDDITYFFDRWQAGC